MTRTLLLALLGLGACSGRPDSAPRTVHQSIEEPMVVLEPRDVEAYRTGVSWEIRIRSQAESLGFAVREARVDSAAADAAGLPVQRYRVIAATVETMLGRGPRSEPDVELPLTPDAISLWSEQRLALDSLRLEVLVLRARTGS